MLVSWAGRNPTKGCSTNWRRRLYICSDRTMALGSTQPLVKMSTRNIPGGKGGRCVRLKPNHLHVPNVMKSGSLNLLEPSGPHRDCYGTPLPFFILYICSSRPVICFSFIFFEVAIKNYTPRAAEQVTIAERAIILFGFEALSPLSAGLLLCPSFPYCFYWYTCQGISKSLLMLL
jgi:hypothetical protein